MIHSSQLYSKTERIYYWTQASHSTQEGGQDGHFEVIRGKANESGRWAGGVCIAICKAEAVADRLAFLLWMYGPTPCTATGEPR